jgi:hypothetical protein
MILAVLRSLVWIWPFISEMFFAGKSFKTILRERWGLALLLSFLALSMSINYIGALKIHKITSATTKPVEPVKINKVNNKRDTDIEEAKHRLRSIYNLGAP